MLNLLLSLAFDASCITAYCTVVFLPPSPATKLGAEDRILYDNKWTLAFALIALRSFLFWN